MAAGLDPERIANNWAACRRYLRAWRRAALAAGALIAGGLCYVEGGRHALAECPPPPAQVAPPRAP